MKKLLIALSFLSANSALSQENQTNLLNLLNPQNIQGGGACVTTNIQGTLAAGFLGYVEGVGTHAIYIDPTGSGAPGDPGCGGDFTNMLFDVVDVTFTVADESAFGTSDGLGVLTYEVSLHPLAVPGDPTMGPGSATVTETQVLNADATGIYSVTTPFPDQDSLTEPFFVSWKLISFVSTNMGVTNTATPLWDGEPRPVGRQFVDNGGGFVDQTDFFISGGNGWVDVIVSGNFRPAIIETDLEVNVTNNAVSPVELGDQFEFIVEALNNGPDDATGVSVTNVLSDNVSYISDTCGGVHNNGTVTWAIGSLLASASALCNITIEVTGYEAITSTASISGDDTDLIAGNNTSSGSVVGVPRVIPTLSFYAMILLIASVLLIYRRKV